MIHSMIALMFREEGIVISSLALICGTTYSDGETGGAVSSGRLAPPCCSLLLPSGVAYAAGGYLA
jgi:hypothetical protein